MSDDPLLAVNGLRTQFKTDRGVVKAVDGISYTVERGETFGVVGESGAGKSVTGLSVLDLIEAPGEIVDGEILYKGQDLLQMDAAEIRHIRGNDIAVIFQDAMTAFNPAFTIGTQISDVIREHNDVSADEAREQAIQLLDDVDIPDPRDRIGDYPHQFSGGMRQRALIAMALSCDPDLIIADEITTGIDVTTQATILELLARLQEERGLAMQFITHDMGVIAEVCDRVGVMYAGELIEVGTLDEVFTTPQHPYTVGLLNALPQSKGPKESLESIPGNMPDLIDVPSGCSFRDRCEHATAECAEVDPALVETDPTTPASDHTSACIRVDEIDWSERDISTSPETVFGEGSSSPTDPQTELVSVDNLRKYFDPESQSWLDRLWNERKYIHAVDDISFSIYEGETLGLVGESGCGKTTLGRTITQLYEPDEGTVLFAGADLADVSDRQLRELRSEYQVIFQDPFASLNPRRTVENIIGRPMELHGVVDSTEERKERVKELLVEVGLKESHLDRYAHEFSGGQKQRIGIARALSVEPDFIVADEPVSALDVSVQAKILNLLMELQESYDLTYLFIAHDLNVVRHISDRIMVMYLGEIIEQGPVDEVFTPPYHPYTEILLSSVPSPTPGETPERKSPQGELPSPSDPPSGCRFHTRCPYAMPECETTTPKAVDITGDHTIQCHLFDEDVVGDDTVSVGEVLEEQRASMNRLIKREGD